MSSSLSPSSYDRSNVGVKALYAANIGALTGGWIADMNKTHMFNPTWTPHAKFHDGMSISAASLAGAAGLYFLASRPFNQRVNTTIAALLPAIIFGAQASAFLYPGAKGVEAENPKMAPKVAGVRMNELPVALVGLALAGIGYFLTKKTEAK